MPAGGKSRVLACKVTNISKLVENPTKDALVMVVYQHPLTLYNRNNYIVYFCSMYFNQKPVIVYQDPSTATVQVSIKKSFLNIQGVLGGTVLKIRSLSLYKIRINAYTQS